MATTPPASPITARARLERRDRRSEGQTFARRTGIAAAAHRDPGGGRTVTLVPFAKSVGGCFGINATQGGFQPTNQIVDFYVDRLHAARAARFRVNFEDVEAGNDHDMDAIVRYSYTVSGSTVTSRHSDYAAGCITQHMGYVYPGRRRMASTSSCVTGTPRPATIRTSSIPPRG